MSLFGDSHNLLYNEAGRMMRAERVMDQVKHFASVCLFYKLLMNCGGKFLKTGKRKEATKLVKNLSAGIVGLDAHPNAKAIGAFFNNLAKSAFECVDTVNYSGEAPEGSKTFMAVSLDPMLTVTLNCEYGGDRNKLFSSLEEMRAGIKKIENGGIGNSNISEELFELAKANLLATEELLDCLGYAITD